jgi:hypothetical protein
MAKYKLTPEERETTINWTLSDEKAFVSTYDAKIIKYLRSVLAKEVHVNIDFIPEGVNFEVPISWIKIRKPATRTLTDEQRQEAGKRMKLARSRGGDDVP